MTEYSESARLLAMADSAVNRVIRWHSESWDTNAGSGDDAVSDVDLQLDPPPLGWRTASRRRFR
ncbi:hypothetical protein ACWCOW_27260 [Streptomyces sp. NPDC001939]